MAGAISNNLLSSHVEYYRHRQPESSDVHTFNVLDNKNTSTVQQQQGRSLSLVVSYWALEPQQQQQQPVHPHRREIQAAMAANLDNPYIDQLVVILDSTSHDSNCTHFRSQQAQLLLQHKYHHPRDKLTCVDRPEGQPSYFEMFNYTLSEHVKGQVVLLSNADQVFDHTIALARFLKPNVVLTLSTWGYNRTLLPNHLREHYPTLVPPEFARKQATETLTKRCPSPLSWDSFVLDPNTIRGTLQFDDFTRLSLTKKNIPFPMNQVGAENAALWSLTNRLEATLVVINACRFIRSWHFHFARKTHHTTLLWKNQPKRKVPGPYAKGRPCEQFRDCQEAFFPMETADSTR